MANYLGDFALSQVFNTKFCTTAAATGAPTTLSGSPAISIYKSNSTTQSTSGVTLSVDFDSVTGLNNVNIDLSSDGTFYATANDFQIIITAGTVGGTSAVGYVVAEFSINNRTPLRPTTAGNTASVDSNGRVDVIKIAGTTQTARDIGASVLLSAGTGTGQLDFTSGVVKSNLVQILATALTETAGFLAAGFKKFFNVSATPSSTMDVIARVTLADTVTAYTGNTPQTGDNFARLGAPVGASISADIAGVQADTDNIQTRIPAALGINGNMKSDVRDFNGTAGTFASGRPEVNSVGDFTATMKTSLNAATPAVTVTDKTGFALTSAYDPAKTAAQAGDAMALTSGERTTLTAAIWAALSSGLSTANSIGKRLVDFITGDTYGRLGAPAGASVSADIAAIQSDTDNIQTRLPSALVSGRMDSSVGAMAANTLTASALATDAVTEIAAAIPTANQNADALLDRTAGVETNWTFREAMRIMLAALSGKLSGAATTTVVIRNPEDNKNRISATVDASGNRSAVSYDKT